MIRTKQLSAGKLVLACVCAVLAAIVIFGGFNKASAQELSPIKVYVDTTRIQFAVEPTVINGTTLVQLRPLFEALDITLKWDGVNRIVSGHKTGLTFTLHIDSNKANVNGTEVQLAEAARIVDGNTLVPLRFIGEATGALVHWDGEYREIVIFTDELLASYGLTKEEAERLLKEPDNSMDSPVKSSALTALQGVYYNMSLDIANYCGGGFCFSYYTFFPDGKVFVDEPSTGGMETVDCTRQTCNEYVLKEGAIIFNQSHQTVYEKKSDGKLLIGDKEFRPVIPFKKDQKLNGLYNNISTYGATLGNAMIGGQILFKSDGTYYSGKVLLGTDFNYTLEQGGYASESSESGTYEIIGNTISFKNDAGELSSMFVMDLNENGVLQNLIIGGRMYTFHVKDK